MRKLTIFVHTYPRFPKFYPHFTCKLGSFIMVFFRDINISLMHTFMVNISLSIQEQCCSPRKSGDEHPFRGLTNPNVNRKRLHHSRYLTLCYIKYFHINLLKLDVHSALKIKIISTIAFQASVTLMRCEKVLHFLITVLIE